MDISLCPVTVCSSPSLKEGTTRIKSIFAITELSVQTSSNATGLMIWDPACICWLGVGGISSLSCCFFLYGRISTSKNSRLHSTLSSFLLRGCMCSALFLHTKFYKGRCPQRKAYDSPALSECVKSVSFWVSILRSPLDQRYKPHFPILAPLVIKVIFFGFPYVVFFLVCLLIGLDHRQGEGSFWLLL